MLRASFIILMLTSNILLPAQSEQTFHVRKPKMMTLDTNEVIRTIDFKLFENCDTLVDACDSFVPNSFLALYDTIITSNLIVKSIPMVDGLLMVLAPKQAGNAYLKFLKRREDGSWKLVYSRSFFVRRKRE